LSVFSVITAKAGIRCYFFSVITGKQESVVSSGTRRIPAFAGDRHLEKLAHGVNLLRIYENCDLLILEHDGRECKQKRFSVLMMMIQIELCSYTISTPKIFS
jgi:hypothetical protein